MQPLKRDRKALSTSPPARGSLSRSTPPSRDSLPYRLVQAQCRRHRHIEAFHRAADRDAGDLVAALLDQTADARAFGAQHPGDAGPGVDAGQWLLAVHVGGDDPDVVFLEVLDGARV